MANCTSCGSEIPNDQGSSCSMCYGDPYHGHDGYYLDWIRQQDERQVADEPPPCCQFCGNPATLEVEDRDDAVGYFAMILVCAEHASLGRQT